MRFNVFILKIVLTLFASVALASPELSCRSLFLSEQSFRYPEIIQNLHPAEPHTIKDMRGYLTSKLGKEVVRNATNQKAEFVILKGPAKDPLAQIDLTDMITFNEISNSFGAFNVIEVVRRNGESTFVFTNVNGESRYLQVLSFLRLAKVPDPKIVVKGELNSYYPLYRRTFQNIGHVPDLIVFGFSNTSFEVITESIARTTISPDYLRAKNKNYAEMKWQKPSFQDHELKNMGVQILSFKSGKKVWLIDNEYGDRASMLMQALQDSGGKNILLLGTAGSLNPKLKVGDFVSPRFFAGENGQKTSVNFVDGSFTRMGTHAQVVSPALETKAWLKQQIERGVDFVDVELQNASSAAQKHTQFDAYLVISDVLNTKNPQDYTEWNESHRRQAKKTLEPILEKKIREIKIQPEDPIVDYQIEYFDVKPSHSETKS